jgi:hypothetical protein
VSTMAAAGILFRPPGARKRVNSEGARQSPALYQFAICHQDALSPSC